MSDGQPDKVQQTLAYEKKFAQVCSEAIAFVRYWKPEKDQLPPVAILDIDGTVLDDRRSKQRFASDAPMPAHAPMKLVYNSIMEKDISVIFVTGRSVVYQEDTEYELHWNRFLDYTELHLFPYNSSPVSTVHFRIAAWKLNVRAELSEKYHIVMTMGDQDMDVSGSHAGEKQFRLPAPPSFETESSCIIL